MLWCCDDVDDVNDACHKEKTMSDKTCEKCVGGTVIRRGASGADYFDVCECRSRGMILVGMLCGECGSMLDGDELKSMGVDDEDYTGGLPSCGPCDGPMECMVVEREEDRPDSGVHERRQ